MLSALLAAAAVLLGLNLRSRQGKFKQRLQRVEQALDDLKDEMRWMRAERRGETATEDGPLFGSDQTPAKAAVVEPPKIEIAEGTSVPPVAAGPGRFAPVPPPAEDGDTAESFEEVLGTRWAVWAGGAALALGGLFLVRFSIEAGLLGPGVRVLMGALLAACLAAAGEWMRRGDIAIPIDALPKAHIPSILTAAGTIIAFGTIYAAHALYGFIGPTVAFVALGATGLIAMMAAALHGPALAGLGLAGAYVTPLLVQSSSPNPWPVVLYLAVVGAAAYVLARSRHWLWLAAAAVGGAFLWGLALVGLEATVPHGLTASAVHTVLQLGLAAFFLAIEPNATTHDSDAEPEPVASAALSALALLAIMVIASSGFGLASRTAFASVAIALLGATAWLAAPVAAAATLGGVIAVAVLLVWPGLSAPPDPSLLAPWAAGVLRLPENISSFMTFGTLATLGPAAAAMTRIWRGSLLKEPITALYCLAATAPPLVALVVAYLRVTQFDISISFALGGAALAALFAIAAERFDKADLAYSVPAYHLAAGAFAAAAVAALAFALAVSLERGNLTVALALAACGTAFIASRRDIALLRYAVAALGVVVLGRLAWDPRIMSDGVGATAIFNWLLIGYGVPAVAFALAARWLRTRGDDLAVRLSDSLAIVFTGLLAFFEIRHLTNNGDVFHAEFGHVEAGLMTFVSLALSFVLARLNLKKANPVFDTASLVFGVGAIAFAGLGLVFGADPYFTGEPVGGRLIFSSLLPAYLLPGLAALFVARHTRGLRPDWYGRGAGVLAVLLIFLYVTLEVRHGFQGASMGMERDTSPAEQWAHSFAWLILGIAFLGYGLVRGSLEARLASAVLIILAALKITFFDLAGIGGIWRALSFLCLGAVLIGIGLVYQKVVFARPSSGPAAR